MSFGGGGIIMGYGNLGVEVTLLSCCSVASFTGITLFKTWLFTDWLVLVIFIFVLVNWTRTVSFKPVWDSTVGVDSFVRIMFAKNSRKDYGGIRKVKLNMEIILTWTIRPVDMLFWDKASIITSRTGSDELNSGISSFSLFPFWEPYWTPLKCGVLSPR